MEKIGEDRVEPKVEVGFDPGGSACSSGYQKVSPPSALKKWTLAIILPLVMAGLTFGLWMTFQSGSSSVEIQTQSLSLEIKSLKETVEQQKSEIDLYKKEIQSMQAGLKSLQEQVGTLKEQLAGLAKKKETPKEKNASSKEIIYTVQKGDTLPSIARKFKVKVDELRRWNRLPSKKNPNPGQKITLHPSQDS